MSSNQPVKKKNLAYRMRKYLVSIFVVTSFAAYALHERRSDPNADGVIVPDQESNQTSLRVPAATIYPPTSAAAPTLTPAPTDTQQATATAITSSPTAAPTDLAATSVPPTELPPTDQLPTQPPPTDVPPTEPPPTEPPPTDVPPTEAPTAVASNGGYKDGQYTGDIADAFYGPVQVKVTIQNGKIADVQFVDYPHDRRRSVQINNQAVPWLQSEALQAQSAQVDIISGATLTSQAFIESLQSALDSARG